MFTKAVLEDTIRALKLVSTISIVKKTMKPKIMKFRQTLFWDVNPKTIDAEKNARYIIERVLEFGDPKEVSWVLRYYPKSTIKKVINLPRVQLSSKSKALWLLMLK